MELRRLFWLRSVLVFSYIVAFFVFLIYGFNTVDATAQYLISSHLDIPAIKLSADVTTLELDGDHLNTPEEIVGSFSRNKNKTLLIGHSSTIFQDLDMTTVGDLIFYDHREYLIREIKVMEKSTIKMRELLKAEQQDTLVIMTCAGQDLGDGDATERLIVTAERV